MSEPRSLCEISFKQGNTTTPRASWARTMVEQHPWMLVQCPLTRGRRAASKRMRKESTRVASLTRRGSHLLQRSSTASAPTVENGGTRKRIAACWPKRRPSVREKEKVAAPMPSQRHRLRQLDLRPPSVDKAQMQCTTGCPVMVSV